MKHSFSVVLLVVLASAFTLRAQAPHTSAPTLSYTEQTALAALVHEEGELQHQVDQLHQQEKQLLADIDAHHPGYRFNPATGEFVKVAPESASAPQK